MSDLDFEELDKAINELYESLDEDDSELMESANDEQQNDAVRSVAREGVAHKGEATKRARRAGRANTGAVARVPAGESVDDDVEVVETAQQATDDATEPVSLIRRGLVILWIWFIRPVMRRFSTSITLPRNARQSWMPSWRRKRRLKHPRKRRQSPAK